MIYKSETEFAKHVKAERLHRVYFLYGEEEYLKQLYLDRLIERSTDSAFSDFNFHQFDGKAAVDEISDAVEALPLMSTAKCVVVDDLDIEKLPATELQKLKQMLEDPPDSCVLIFVMREVLPSLAKSAKYKAVSALIDKNGAVMELKPRTGSDLAKFIMDRAKKGGSEISREAALYLVSRCGTDMQLLSGEVDKLAAYKLEKGIEKADIDCCSPAKVESSVFDISKAIGRGDYVRAMRILSDLFYLKEQAVAIVGALGMYFIDLYRAKVASLSGRSLQEVVSAFDYKGREFRARNAAGEAGRYSIGFLRDCLDLITETDRQLKSSRSDDRILLEQLLTRIFVLRQEEN